MATNENTTVRLRLASVTLLALVSLVPCSAAHATTRWVANNGVDAVNTCAVSSSPCRTITRAIAQAVSNETIFVAPGIYGDIDGDGAFTSVGDEVPTVAHPDCVIDVNKTLHIRSLSTFTTPTVITAGDADMNIVCVYASLSRLRGFTFTRNGPTKPAVLIDGSTFRVRVERNLATGTGAGFDGSGTDVTLLDNRAIATLGIGFSLTNGTGFHSQVSRNVAMDNEEHGYYFASINPVAVRGNVAGGNKLVGFFMDAAATGISFRGNSALGNREHGMQVEPTAAFSGLLSSSFFGNGTEIGFSPGNCGVFNDTGGALTATNNFWGVAAGPGADPADNVCNSGGSTTTVTPVLSGPASVTLSSVK